MTEKVKQKIVSKYMIKNNKTFQKIKHKENFTNKYKKKNRKKVNTATNYQFSYWGTNSVGHPYE